MARGEDFPKIHGRDRDMFKYVWSDKQCTRCGFMIVSDVSKIPSSIGHPEWHVDCQGLCSLCFVEGAVASGQIDATLGEDDNLLKSIYRQAASLSQRDPKDSQS
jgi:hypothetical protein